MDQEEQTALLPDFINEQEPVAREFVNHDTAVKMLGSVKKAMVKAEGEATWEKYISSFETKYRTRKKLVEKVRGAHLIPGW